MFVASTKLERLVPHSMFFRHFLLGECFAIDHTFCPTFNLTMLNDVYCYDLTLFNIQQMFDALCLTIL